MFSLTNLGKEGSLYSLDGSKLLLLSWYLAFNNYNDIMTMSKHIDSLLCAKDCPKCFMHVNFFNPYDNYMVCVCMIIIIFPILLTRTLRCTWSQVLHPRSHVRKWLKWEPTIQRYIVLVWITCQPIFCSITLRKCMLEQFALNVKTNLVNNLGYNSNVN